MAGFWDTDFGRFLSSAGTQASRGLKAARDATNPFQYAGDAAQLAAGALPGAGLVQGQQDFQRGHQAISQGNYGQALGDYLSGFGNVGLEAVPGGVLAGKVAPAILAGIGAPALKFASVDVLKKPTAQSVIHSMEPYVTVSVKHGDTPEDILDNLSTNYGLEHPAPKHVFEKDMQDYSQMIEDPAVLDAIRQRLDLAQKNNMIPGPDVEDSDLHFMLSADRSPDSTWAQYFGENVAPERKAEVDAAVAEAGRARAKNAASARAYEEFLAAGGTPMSPQGVAAWNAANPGRQQTRMIVDETTGVWRSEPRFIRNPRTGEMTPVMAPGSTAAGGK